MKVIWKVCLVSGRSREKGSKGISMILYILHRTVVVFIPSPESFPFSNWPRAVSSFLSFPFPLEGRVEMENFPRDANFQCRKSTFALSHFPITVITSPPPFSFLPRSFLTLAILPQRRTFVVVIPELSPSSSFSSPASVREREEAEIENRLVLFSDTRERQDFNISKESGKQQRDRRHHNPLLPRRITPPVRPPVAAAERELCSPSIPPPSLSPTRYSINVG